MAHWGGLGSRGQVEDRRGFGPTAVGGGLGLTGIIIVLAVQLLGGGDVTDIVTELQNSQAQPQQTYQSSDFEGEDSYEVFASTVLGSTTDLWSQLFSQTGKRYVPPKLVLFRGSTQSACGGATSEVGPHYCPGDRTIYLDETFFDELTKRFQAKGGDVAEAYVIAHEVGHHVQEILGTLEEVTDEASSIKTELQADCFAGLWAYSIRELGVFEPGEIAEALDAASAVGDDRIQEAVTGRVTPETWTHGSSAQRVSAFTKGYETGSFAQCGM
ncbi:neutral zinc metallopeptidase [Patescibacteria group bacterium]|nr:neutral zinc metallopeptidase [Patescibacteria group bacterium]